MHDETYLTVEIVLRDLASTSNFVKFRDSWNFTFFEVLRVARDTWHVLSGPQCVTCQVQNESNKSSSMGPCETCGNT